MRTILATVFLALTLGLSGCGLLPVRHVYICPDIPDISRPIVPTFDIDQPYTQLITLKAWLLSLGTVEADMLAKEIDEVLDSDIRSDMATRERLIVGYSLELEAAIRAIRSECE